MEDVNDHIRIRQYFHGSFPRSACASSQVIVCGRLPNRDLAVSTRSRKGLLSLATIKDGEWDLRDAVNTGIDVGAWAFDESTSSVPLPGVLKKLYGFDNVDTAGYIKSDLETIGNLWDSIDKGINAQKAK